MPDMRSPHVPTNHRSIGVVAAASDHTRTMVVFVSLVATLYFGRAVLIPVTLALLLAFILAPLVGLLRRIYLGRVPSVLLGVLLALGMALAFGSVIVTQIAGFATDLPRYIATVETKVAVVKSLTVGRATEMAHRALPQPPGSVASPPPPNAPDISGTFTFQKSEVTLLGLVHEYLPSVLSQVANFAIIFVVAVFALLQAEDLRDRLISLAGLGHLATDDPYHRRRGPASQALFLYPVGCECSLRFGHWFYVMPDRASKPTALGHAVRPAPLRTLRRSVPRGRLGCSGRCGGRTGMVDGCCGPSAYTP